MSGMGIKYESGHEAMRLQASGVSGTRAVDGYLLRFGVSYQLSAWQNVFGLKPSIFRGFRARIPDADNRRVDYARDEALMVYSGVADAVNYLA